MVNTRYEKSYDRDMNNSYLVINASKLKLEAYQKMILLNNEIKGVLPMNFKSLDQETFIYYNITSKISIGDYIKNKKLVFSDLEKIIKSIEAISDIANEYLLDEGLFEINSESIFFELGTNNCYFIYIPCETSENNMYLQVKELIDYMFSYVDHYDERAVSLIHKLKIVIEEDGFSIKLLKELLDNFEKDSELKGYIKNYQNNQNNLSNKPMALKESNSLGIQDKPEKVNKLSKIKKLSKRNNTNEINIVNKASQVSSANQSQEISRQEFSQLEKSGSIQNENNKLLGENKTKEGLVFSRLSLITIITQIILIVVIYFTVTSGLLQSTYVLHRALKIGYLVICVVSIEGLIISMNLYKANKKSKATSQGGSSIFSSENKSIVQVQEGPKINKTEILTAEKKTERAYLIKDNTKIPVINMPFTIGKLEGNVDCIIENPLVSRIHGQITKEEDGYYYKDLNSRNGTYLNNEKILSNHNYILENNYKICFANEKYVFRLL
jgi:hypothetical protein